MIYYNLLYQVHVIHSYYLIRLLKQRVGLANIFFSHKNFSTSSLSLTKICSISCTCNYSDLHVADLQTYKRWLATHLISPVLISPLCIQNFFFKTGSKAYIPFATTFTCYQMNNAFLVASSYFVLACGSMKSKLSRYYLSFYFIYV